jgi:hypothetical protein
LTALGVFATFRRAAEIGILYFQFWDPRFLFVHGAPVLRHSTGHVGVFLVSVAGLLVVGMVRAARRAVSDAGSLLLLGGFLLAPLPASLVDFNDRLASHAIWRAVAVLPFGALAGLGLEYLFTGASTRKRQLALCIALGTPLCLVAANWDSLPRVPAILLGLVVPPAIAGLSILRSRLAEPGIPRSRRPSSEPLIVAGVVAALGIVSLLQYGDFYIEYMTGYRTRFVAETDGNMRGVLEAVIAHSPVIEPSQRGPVPTVYLGFRLGPADWGGYYWRFYLRKHHREDLLLRTVNDENASQFNHERICHMAPGSLLATRVGWDKTTDSLIERMMTRGELTREAVIGEPIYWLMRTTDSCTT